MERIASFSIDHTKLLPGIYLSRQDSFEGKTVTTFDLRITAPNREPVMDMPALHTIEHLGATFLRNSEKKDEILYFGPMGCRTGCYLLMFGEKTPQEIAPLILEMCDFILNFQGEIPGAKAEECGNWQEHNADMAKFYINRYQQALIHKPSYTYSVL